MDVIMIRGMDFKYDSSSYYNINSEEKFRIPYCHFCLGDTLDTFRPHGDVQTYRPGTHFINILHM